MHGEDAALLSLLLIVWLPRWIFGFSGHRHEAIAYLVILGLSTFLMPYYRFSALILFLLMAVIASSQLFSRRGAYSGSHVLEKPRDVEQGRLKPLILPCRITHTRLFPKQHGFSYSYLQVGVPVGWKGCIASMIAADRESQDETKRPAWTGLFKVEAADHLDRGNNHVGLRGKLDMYIQSQGGVPETYPFAYLITAPRFFGYCFNPVSFWYLYSADLHLQAMILEVNNTFDERRMYFLEGSSNGRKADAPLENANDSTFSDRWAKDFHVSPFNSRKGSYSLSAHNPFTKLEDTRVSNTITLNSSKEHVKLVARLFSTAPAIDPAGMTLGQKFGFVVSWWWIGFVTYPRIVQEAGKLFFRRRLHVSFRPEVVRTSIGRRETARERIIESCFRRYLGQTVTKRHLKYVSSGSACLRSEVFPHDKAHDIASPSVPTLQILTPLVYSQLALHPNPPDLVRSILAQPDDARSIHAAPAEAVLDALLRSPSQPTPPFPKRQESWLDRVRWYCVGALCSQRNSRPLDDFVRAKVPIEQARRYVRAVLALRVSDWVSGGIPEVIDAVAWLSRMALCWLCARTVIQALQAWEHSDDWASSTKSWWSTLLAIGHLWLVLEGAIVGKRQRRNQSLE